MSASSSAENAALAKKIVGILKRRFGEIPWWPGDTDEVMIGAILTQQTRWENVEQALRLLKERNLCSLSALCAADLPDIESVYPWHRVLPDKGTPAQGARCVCHRHLRRGVRHGYYTDRGTP